MVVSSKFNNSYKTSPASDLMLGLYVSSNYGSNAFDFAQAARIATPVNEHAAHVPDAAKKAQYKP